MCDKCYDALDEKVNHHCMTCDKEIPVVEFADGTLDQAGECPECEEKTRKAEEQE